MAENCDTMLEVLHKHKLFERIRDPENCDVRVFFGEGFSPGHVNITTIIIEQTDFVSNTPCCMEENDCDSDAKNFPVTLRCVALLTLY